MPSSIGVFSFPRFISIFGISRPVGFVDVLFEPLVEYLAVAGVHLEVVGLAIVARDLDVVDHVAVGFY